MTTTTLTNRIRIRELWAQYTDAILLNDNRRADTSALRSPGLSGKNCNPSADISRGPSQAALLRLRRRPIAGIG